MSTEDAEKSAQPNSLEEEIKNEEVIDTKGGQDEAPKTLDAQNFPPTLQVVASSPDEPLSKAPPVKLPQQIAGFEILGILGRGGMGVVYLAKQPALDRRIALKMILGGTYASEEDLERFRKEGQALAKLDHPNIVKVFEFGEHDAVPYLALEYCPKGSLTSKLVPGKQMPPAEAVELIATLARAIHAAHEAGIIHRDLKPSNVLLDKDEKPKICDFGLVKAIDSERGRTVDGSVLGTPTYMAPEQAAGTIDLIGPETDVYALGVMLHEALIGKTPFKANSLADALEQVKNKEPDLLRKSCPDIHRDLEAIVLQCLQKQPKNRYRSALALAEDLDRWSQGDPVHARPQNLVHRAVKRIRKNRGALFKIGIVALVPIVAGLAIWLALRPPQTLAMKRHASAISMMKRIAAEYTANPSKYQDVFGEGVKATWVDETPK